MKNSSFIIAFMLLVAACTGEKETGNNFVPIDRPPAPETTVTVDTSFEDFDRDCFSNVVEQMLGHDYKDVEDHPVDEDGNCIPDQFEQQPPDCIIQEKEDGQLEAVCNNFSVPITSGEPGSSCTVTNSTDGTFLQCEDGTSVEIKKESGIDYTAWYAQWVGSVPRVNAYTTTQTGELDEKLWHGTGVVVGENLILTNYHVCENLEEDYNAIVLEFPSKGSTGRDIKFDHTVTVVTYVTLPERDLCLLRGDTQDRTSLPIAESTELAQGMELMIISYPLDHEFHVAFGKIVSFHTAGQVGYDNIDEDTYLIDYDADPDNSSGSPLITPYGKLACINFGGHNTHRDCIDAYHVASFVAEADELDWQTTFTGETTLPPPPDDREPVLSAQMRLGFSWEGTVNRFYAVQTSFPDPAHDVSFWEWEPSLVEDQYYVYTVGEDLIFNWQFSNNAWGIELADRTGIRTDPNALILTPDCTNRKQFKLSTSYHTDDDRVVDHWVDNGLNGGNLRVRIVGTPNTDGTWSNCQMQNKEGRILQ